MSQVDITEEEYKQFDEQLTKVNDEILANLNSPEWKFSKDEADGCKIYVRHVADSSYDMIKATISIPVSQRDALEAIKPCKEITPKTPKAENEGLLERKIFNYDEKDPSARAFIYCSTPSPFPLVAGRDFLLYRKVIEKDDKLCYTHTSVVCDKIMPQKKGFVRGLMKQQAFIFEKDPSNPEHTLLSFILHTEIGGSIPTFAYNMAAVGQGKSVIELRKRAIEYVKNNSNKAE
ncbi:hypothetical protein TVAG_104730 [Trichomonas vaginalis G3]|uniref:START domain-containing protein n=1 Tax=Trichomonas vaginalis (strain ATCC PRA-98 / G3) TaxID=412133 RepID=A2FNU7_TRIV3|nr:lipid-binding START domain-containing protein [Trichomonas vaginalis G3]EAX93428.1 hypothetical protein TVAG_104730 [Trichomonas vaginalis G3]KAI5506167.1 lipid-binding START domain-containing protein [Trichomonas vaginalis G3]|eukprot:XP_001306358.1 hypothetical protein [Trichomonas vaginalis G3]